MKKLRDFFKIVRSEGPYAALESTRRFAMRRSPLKSKHPKLIKLNSYRIYCKNKIRYDIPARPFKTVRVKPSEVKYSSEMSYSWGLGRVKGGNWDKEDNLRPVDDIPTFKGLKQRFVEDADWEDTVYVKYAEKRLRAGKTPYGYKNVEDFIQGRCGYVEKLYTEIKNNGYRPQSEYRNPKGPGSSPHRLEPIITISRDGEIHFASSGNHRFAIAQILDLQIPCNVAVRHKRWQLLRDEIHKSESTAEHRDAKSHPDLVDIT